MPSLLTLDHSTLFYWTLSDTTPTQNRVSQWALAVPIGNPTSRPPSVASYARSTAPSLTSGASRSSAPSVITDNVKIINRESTSVKVKTEIPTISLNDNGGLSDNDELMGEEREVAIKSPPKGKKRVTSEVGYCLFLYIIRQFESHCDQKLIVQTATAAGKAGSNLKRPSRNEELPDWIDAQWFRYTFVPTYMAFVGQTVDPWDVPVKQAVAVMQKIWNAISSEPYEITDSAPVYKKVSDWLSHRTILQYVSDCSTPCGFLAQCYRIHGPCCRPGVLRFPTRFEGLR